MFCGRSRAKQVSRLLCKQFLHMVWGEIGLEAIAEVPLYPAALKCFRFLEKGMGRSGVKMALGLSETGISNNEIFLGLFFGNRRFQDLQAGPSRKVTVLIETGLEAFLVISFCCMSRVKQVSRLLWEQFLHMVRHEGGLGFYRDVFLWSVWGETGLEALMGTVFAHCPA